MEECDFSSRSLKHSSVHTLLLLLFFNFLKHFFPRNADLHGVCVPVRMCGKAFGVSKEAGQSVADGRSAYGIASH